LSKEWKREIGSSINNKILLIDYEMVVCETDGIAVVNFNRFNNRSFSPERFGKFPWSFEMRRRAISNEVDIDDDYIGNRDFGPENDEVQENPMLLTVGKL
jgi:hypothetical protein